MPRRLLELVSREVHEACGWRGDQASARRRARNVRPYVRTADDAIAPVSTPNAAFVVGAAGFESEAEKHEMPEKEAASSSEVVVETPTGDRSRGPEADLAHAMRLAAEAGQWGIVADLSRQLDAVRRGCDRRGKGLDPTDHKLAHGGRSEDR